MNRRNFLTAAGAAIAGLTLAGPLSAILPLPKRYVLYGDGVHDDTAALQAWVDGKKVYWSDGSLIPEHNLVGYDKEFRITKSVDIGRAKSAKKMEGGLYVGDLRPNQAMFQAKKTHHHWEFNSMDFRSHAFHVNQGAHGFTIPLS